MSYTTQTTHKKFTGLLCLSWCRKSKLTLLLKDVLGGNCKTKALITLRPSESLALSCVLRIAGQLAQIKNFPILNDSMAKVDAHHRATLESVVTLSLTKCKKYILSTF